ncbi:MAG: hypothetical protein UY81_C0011G0019 [Candidatus Giovannonibacteria bacterium GW2011_GWA2_53_7]|uniref:TraC-like domain-containing protein n=1 Tax=Candidatus Giovannonibacteria bacterium GW2011_GWA2_53_7 TaxID=1618650 RepID=A0A0G2AVE8_9BACT|nr:MAG: hypothetical protein UY81_C0011G0019 [Candidatus Giovannonibacteria bacterium GW2011_GWA2_53_7]
MRNKKPKQGPPAQNYLDIAEIREGIVVLKDGTLRAVLMVSSINFALKSEDEQQAIIQGYMSFLNALEYPIQVVIQSRKMNIDAYLLSLNQAERETKNDALRNQILDYRSFIQELVSLGEIMQKRFYLVIPYDPLTDKGRGFFKRLGSALSPARILKLKSSQFAERKKQIDRRVSIIQGALQSMSLTSVPMDTQGLMELYYNAYNPDVFESERLADMNQLRMEEGF